MMNNNLNNIVQSGQLECELLTIEKEIENFISKTELYMKFIDIKYNDKLRDMELIRSIQAKQDEMFTIINRINVIELKAIPLKDDDLMMNCECKKAKLINLMMYMQSKYGC